MHIVIVECTKYQMKQNNNKTNELVYYQACIALRYVFLKLTLLEQTINPNVFDSLTRYIWLHCILKIIRYG